jgi:hypothetical protein
MKLESKWLSRKFIITIALEVLTTALLCFKAIDSNSWVEMTKWIWIVYGVANPASKIISKKST